MMHDYKEPEKKKKKPTPYVLFCSDCLKRFASSDYAEPAESLVLHKEFECRYRPANK